MQEQRVITRFGAIAQMLSIASMPIPLVGPADNDRVILSGYAVLSNQGTMTRQTETYTLRRSETEGLWSGEYRIVQTPVAARDSGAPKTEMLFEVQLELREINEEDME